MKQLKENLSKIHSSVFKNFKYQTDLEQYNLLEKWVMPSEQFNRGSKLIGDCEDFALACRKLCRDIGIADTRLVFCQTEEGEGHCVLECKGFILDNRMKSVFHFNHKNFTGYKWISMSGYNPGDAWHEIR